MGTIKKTEVFFLDRIAWELIFMFKKATFILVFVGLSLTWSAGVIAQQKNSTRKIRVKPSSMAAKVGTAISWQESVDDALKLSKETGKPVFWYVPTLNGTFMDRKKEIDRYMMSGPFSWPQIISMLNERFIPVKARPNKSLRKEYSLEVYKFVEPGFLILSEDGKQEQRSDRITTMHPRWLYSLIGKRFGDLPSWDAAQGSDPKRAELDNAWAEFRLGNWDAKTPQPLADDRLGAEKLLLRGMFEFRKGDHERARVTWKKAGMIQPDHPLAWKAAAEAENFGPFVRGFEVHRNLPPAAMTAGIQSIGSAAPDNVYSEDELWKRSLEFLMGMQNSEGGFVDSDYDFGGSDSLPNVHTAVTSLVGMALIEARDKFKDEFDDTMKGRVENSIRRAIVYVNDPKNINRFDRDEILWAHSYRLRFLCRAIRHDKNLDDSLQQAIKDLENIQMKNGSWYHEYANPFVTATALLALDEGKRMGGEVDKQKMTLGLKRLESQRYNNGGYPYYARNKPKETADDNLVFASAGRMPICDLALWIGKKTDDKQLQAAVQASLKHHELLNRSYKYDNHTSTFAYGGFFFWYDMRSRTEAINYIADEEARGKFADQQRKLVMSLPEIDGCFVDSHELGRCYGTAMALLCLGRLGDR
ncbi:terpene cyclase/mutase family protein [Vicingaceae bacterium]|nr:terpene cyclase/mutase family protein [Vicingaceae bacterium]